jgi:hypothetical protein
MGATAFTDDEYRIIAGTAHLSRDRSLRMRYRQPPGLRPRFFGGSAGAGCSSCFAIQASRLVRSIKVLCGPTRTICTPSRQPPEPSLPLLPRPVLYCFGNVRRSNALLPRQIRDRPRQFDYPVISPCAELHLTHRRAQELLRHLVKRAEVFVLCNLSRFTCS